MSLAADEEEEEEGKMKSSGVSLRSPHCHYTLPVIRSAHHYTENTLLSSVGTQLNKSELVFCVTVETRTLSLLIIREKQGL